MWEGLLRVSVPAQLRSVATDLASWSTYSEFATEVKSRRQVPRTLTPGVSNLWYARHQ